MSARFRIVHFMPDLLSGARVPIAALIQGEDRHVRIAQAERIPGPDCVGGREAWYSLSMALEDLRLATSFELLPTSIGPFVQMEEPRTVPTSVKDPVRWVREHVLPRQLVDLDDQVDKPLPVTKRQVVGRTFLRNWKVAKYVKDNFNGVDMGFPGTVYHVSHWVPGKTGLLLMEPIVGDRSDFHEELLRVNSTFLAWRQLFENRRKIHPRTRDPEFIAYVLDARRGEAATVREQLQASRAEVINVDRTAERQQFVSRIIDVGTSSSSGSQGELIPEP